MHLFEGRSARSWVLVALILGAIVALFARPNAFDGSPLAVAAAPREHEVEFTVLKDGEPRRVRVAMLVDGEASEEEVSAATEEIAARFGSAPVTGEEAVHEAEYATIGARWANSTATWYYNPAGSTVGVEEGYAAVSGASAAWGNAGSGFAFKNAGYTTRGTGTCEGNTDGQNTVAWRSQPTVVLALTCWWVFDGTSGQEFFEFDIEIDPRWGWTTSSENIGYDLQSVLLHEFGHAVGLAHMEWGCPGSAIMCPSYSGNVLLRTPMADDVASLQSLYPPRQAPPPPPPPPPPAPAPQKEPLPLEQRLFRVIVFGATHQ